MFLSVFLFVFASNDYNIISKHVNLHLMAGCSLIGILLVGTLVVLH